jgi:hypothetical protein
MLLSFPIRRSVVLLIIAILLALALAVLTAPHATSAYLPSHLLAPAQGGGVGG